MRRRGAAAALLGALLGCQGPGVPVAELPDEPIAISWREPESARRRAEYLASFDPARRQERHDQRWGTVGVVPVDEVQPLLEEIAGRPSLPGQMEYAGRLALLDPRSGELTPIASARRGSRPAAWSPRRQRLLFSQLEGRYLQLYEYDLASQEVRPVTRGPTVHPRGCYGPGGRLVLMTAEIENGRPVKRIAITGPGGLDPRPLSPGPADHSPTCAPDGRHVAWVTTPPSGRSLLYALTLEGDGEPVPRRLGPGRDPSFSPDGRWVVYSALVGGQWQLWRVRPDGRGRARIGDGVLDETQPVVSPDGRHVAYVVEQEFRSVLYLRRLDGSGDRILFREGDVEYPVW